ncbi:MAG: diguanylate cyclase [Synergistaceae bacterium]|nr:diguanylate cyclase [Synergistaceae bacterium]
MTIWSGVLDSCPGLLCCVVNIKGRLIHATNGYKSAALRLFGHKCETGSNYPPMITDLDRALHDLLMAACLGNTDAIEVSEENKIWEITASPLKVEPDGIVGVVMRITPSVNNQDRPAIIQSNPDILNSVPFRAGVVDMDGVFLAVNKFLASSAEINFAGENIINLVDDEEIGSQLAEIINNRAGQLECRMFAIKGEQNFFSFSDSDYLDKEFNAIPSKEPEDRIINIHASPIDWNGSDAVMLTFEDVTNFRKTREQLRKILTFENHTNLLNKRGLEHAILRELSSTIKESGYLSLIILNIDNLKQINESDGYMSGNRIMRDFVNGMQKILSRRSKSTLGRWSTHEFMILSDCSGASAVTIADEIRNRFDRVKLSAGVADLNSGIYPGVHEFIGAAYDAMTQAIKSGGNKTVLAR